MILPQTGLVDVLTLKHFRSSQALCVFTPNFHFRLAVKYIKHMQYLMAIPPNQNIPQHIVEFDPGVPSWRKNPQVPFRNKT